MSNEKTPTQHDETMAGLLTIAHCVLQSISVAKDGKEDHDANIKPRVLNLFDSYKGFREDT